jgi:hypothetical protein
MEDPEIAELADRISRLCENIALGVQDCANPEHLLRIAGALECVFMSGHDDIDYEDEPGDRRPDA